MLIFWVMLTSCVLADEQGERVEAVRSAVQIWEKQAATFDIHYRLHTLWIPTATPAFPELAKLTQPVLVTDEIRDVRAGSKVLHACRGQALFNGKPIEVDWEMAFDGANTFQRRRDRVYRRPGMVQIGRRPWPTNLSGLDALAGALGNTIPNVRQISVTSRNAGVTEIVCDFARKGEPVGMRWVFAVRADKPYMVLEMMIYDMPEQTLLTSITDVEYHEFAPGLDFPVRGVQRDYHSNGEMWSEITFSVDVERSRIHPAGGIPDDTFRINAPPGSSVIDVTATRAAP